MTRKTETLAMAVLLATLFCLPGYGQATPATMNFRVPPDTAKGTATIQVSAAWIAGPAVTIPIQ